MMNSKKPFDFLIFMTVLLLLSLGTIMVFSSGAPHAYHHMQGDTYHFLKRQLVYLPIGLFAMFVTMNIDYRKLGKLSPLLLIGSIGLLVLVLVPGIGAVYNGARRWINIGGQTVQPSEFAKLAVILFFSHSLSKRREKLKYFFRGLFPYLILLGIFAALLMKQPHLSATLVICSVAAIILFCAGAKIRHFVLLGVPAVAGVFALVITSPYRYKRLVSFLDPWSDPQGGGWQVVQSLYAIGSGGLFGRGLGKSLQKFLYIPEPYNDFILAVLAEELGFIGVFTVLLLFLIFIWRGIKISINAPDVFGCLLATGITSLIAVQVIINVAVVTSSMPVTGMPLPFFSYGGTSLVFLLSGIGILLNISKHSNYDRV
ncbi:MAG TPA: stage V sporulation protein E [Ruminiclostridium sp.]|uniref:stage V sporulation protein E n=1 Tax=Acetivibrio saccincola TaxID=1677857 RepID=UPI000EE07AB8|nr:stage V sporulation protein E [Acetivibrio saccincola]NLW28198.1 stage V sporulation protein E [Acetivibrio saccincola]HAA43739.1 stage V sporulation protein E [Ruminiclostridium sp.]